MKLDENSPLQIRPRVWRTALHLGLLVVIIALLVGFAEIVGNASPRREAEEGYATTRLAPAEAADAYTAQIARDPKNHIFYLRRGLMRQKTKQYELAIADFGEAIRLNESADTAETLGELVWNMGAPRTHLWNLKIEAYVARAEIYATLDQTAEAMADLDAAIALNHRNTAAVQQRGMLRIVAGLYPEARADFDAVLARGVNIDALFARGLTRYLERDWAGASADFKAAEKRAPTVAKLTEWAARAQANAEQPLHAASYQPPSPDDIAVALRFHATRHMQ